MRQIEIRGIQMEGYKKLTVKEKVSYGLGAVGKDMVYMLSASYVLYYFQDVMGVSAVAMGMILMAARFFDAFNDPVMGIIVAKTKTRWGKFRPWLMIGTITNAVILCLMFSAPPALNGAGLVAYAATTYILWGVTYTMMDIPYWSMIPAFTEGGKEREGLTTLARSCAGAGSAIITIITMMCVQALGKGMMPEGSTARAVEAAGFRVFAIIIALLFVIFITMTCISIKENSTVDMETASVGDMFRALISNDQTMAVVIAIVCINCSVYITSNLVIYFFKYDFGGPEWYKAYTLFNTFGGAMQILSMMLFFPLLRRFFSSRRIYDICIGMAVAGYGILLVLAFTNMSSVFLLFIPAFFIFSANGILTVLTTVFLANTVDYGELKNNRRDESVVFSMQTFVVKLASGVAAFVAAVSLQIFSLSTEATTAAEQTVDFSAAVTASSKIGLRMTMTIIPVAGLIFAFFWFRKRFILTDERVREIANQVNSKRGKQQ